MATASFRRGRFIAVTAAVLFAVGGLTILLGTGDDEAEPPMTVLTTLPERTTTTTTTMVASATITAGGEVGLPERGGEEPMPYEGAQPLPLPPMGIATTEFDWLVIELPISPDAEVWLDQLVEIDGRYWAVGGGYDMAAERQYAHVWESSDGITWAAKELPAAFASGGFARFMVTEEGVVATVERWDEASAVPTLRVFVSPDGEAWRESDLSAFAAGDHLWLSHVAGGGGTIVVAGSREPMVPQPDELPIITIAKGGLVVEVDDADGSYVISDAASGDTVAEGSMEGVWSHQEEMGVAIYDPSGDVLFRTAWEVLDEAAVAAYEQAPFGEPLAIEVGSDGATLAINEYSDSVTVTGADGAVVFTGSGEDLWRGRPPTFTDPRSGEVLLTLTWEEWEEAIAAAYPEPAVWTAAPVLLRSTDLGGTWTEPDVTAVAGGAFHFSGMAYGPAGFVAVGTVEQGLCCAGSAGEPAVLASGDGLTWTTLATNLGAEDRLFELAASDDGYMALVEGGRVLSSADGATWETELAPDDLELPLGTAWFERVGPGGLGTFVSGTRDGWEDPAAEPVAITRGGRTLTVELPIYTLSDDATGDVLARFDESEAWEGNGEDAGPADTGFGWGQGGLALYDDDGMLLFSVSGRQFDEAMGGGRSEPEVLYQSEPVLLMSGDGGWTSVPLPDIGDSSRCTGMVVGDGRVILATTQEVATEHHFEMKLTMLVGKPR